MSSTKSKGLTFRDDVMHKQTKGHRTKGRAILDYDLFCYKIKLMKNSIGD